MKGRASAESGPTLRVVPHWAFAIAGTITYKLNRLMQAKAEIRQEWLRSTTPGVDYAATVFMLVVTKTRPLLTMGLDWL